MTVRIERIGFEETLFRPLLAEAPREGGRFLLRLRDEWLDGDLRFDGPGELLLGAFLEGELVGVGGISHDPYDPEPRLGRVRHLYVLKKHRRCGIGGALIDRLLAHGREHFEVLRLSTKAAEAARLYESYGFAPVERHKQSHWLEF